MGCCPCHTGVVNAEAASDFEPLAEYVLIKGIHSIAEADTLLSEYVG